MRRRGQLSARLIENVAAFQRRARTVRKPCVRSGRGRVQTAGAGLQAPLTFGAVIVPVQVAVLRLPLPPHDVVTEVPVGQGRRVPLHDELRRRVGRGQNVQGNGRNWKGEQRTFQKTE